jgi:hypothetical protein
MPEMGALLLATQAMAAPGELLNLSLNASAVLPEGAVLLAMIATLLVDLAGEKVAARWVPPICYLGLGSALGPTGTPMECPPGTLVPWGVFSGQPRRCFPCRHCHINAVVTTD